MYNTERLKHLIGEASFDGWIENGGPNGDQDGKCQLLREEDALNAITEAKNDFPNKQEYEKNGCLVWNEVVQTWFKKWFGVCEEIKG